MRNIKIYFLVSIVLIALIGCAAAPKITPKENNSQTTRERADKTFEELDQRHGGTESAATQESRRKQFEKKPYWVENYPNPDGNIVGIGMAEKTDNKEDDIKRAKSSARNELAAQIRVKIDSETDYMIQESNIKTDKRSCWYSEQDISTRIRSMVSEEIEGIQLVDSWESEDDYWFYYKLSKAELERQIKERLENSKRLAVDFYKKAIDYKNSHQYVLALEYFGKAYNSLIDYLGKPVETMLDGSTVLINNEIERQLSSILSNLELTKVNDGQLGRIGAGTEKPLIVKVVYGQNYPVKSVKVNFNVVDGEAEITKESSTNFDGMAECRIDQILMAKNSLKIKAIADLRSSLNLEHDYAKTLIENRFVIFSIGIRNKTIFMKTIEEVLGKKRTSSLIESQIKDLIVKSCHTDFSDNERDADCLLEVRVTTRKGSDYHGEIFFSYADLSVKLIELKTGKQLYQSEQTGIKGAGLDYEKASLKAITNIRDELEGEFVRDVVNAIEGKI